MQRGALKEAVAGVVYWEETRRHWTKSDHALGAAVAKAREEEQLLAAKHGEYGQWAEEVPRFFPPPRRLLERVGLSKPAE